MSFEPNDLVSSPVARIRLLTGDIQEQPLLEDGVYEYLYLSGGNDETKAALEALETIINMLVMNPQDGGTGSYKATNSSLRNFQSIYDRLKLKSLQDASGVNKIPMIARSDRNNWDDINGIFQTGALGSE